MNRSAGIVYLCAVLAFAGIGVQPLHAGVLTGTSGVRMVQTVYFDIIYPPGSAASASILEECADRLYEYACAELGASPYFRMPVVLTPSHDTLNAYFTPLPYNRIVVYDTLPGADDSGSLAVFSRSLQSVFYHELVHAVSLNIKSPAFRVLSAVFADCMNPALAVVPTLFSEGASVALESAAGEGRLNDAFSTHMLYQAKLEGVFPHWRNAAGARDVYPSGTVPYLFGGAFTRYLIQTYGKERYAEFWYQCGRLQFFKLTAGIFKKVYGLPLADAWRAFESQLVLPDVSAAPDALVGVEHLVPDVKKTLYRSLTSSPAGVAWIDPYTSSVRFAENGTDVYGEIGGDTERAAVTLVTLSGLKKISFSPDGSYLAMSRTLSGTFSKNEVFIYRMSSRTLERFPAAHVREGTVVRLSNGGYAAAAIRSGGTADAQSAEIVLYEITETDSSRFRFSSEPVFLFRSDSGVSPYSLCAVPGGKLAFTVRSAEVFPFTTQSLFLLDPVSGAAASYTVPESVGYRNVKIRSVAAVPEVAAGLSRPPFSEFADDDRIVRLVFSWAAEGTFPRAGFLTVGETGAFFSLMAADVSGGVYAPVVYDTAADRADDAALISSALSGSLAYSAHLFGHDCLMLLDCARVPFLTVAVESGTVRGVLLPQSASAGADNADFTGDAALTSSAVYSPLRYLLHGVFLPAALLPQYDLLAENGTALLPGATWITADPAETVILSVGGGIDPFTLRGGMRVSGRTTGTSFSVRASSDITFSKNGFDQAVTAAGFTASVSAGRVSRFVFSGSLSYLASSVPATGFLHAVEHIFKTEYSTFRASGRGYYNVRGVSAAVFTDTLYAFRSDSWYGNIGVSVAARIPGPVPVRLNASLFADVKTFARFSGEAVVCSFEIQQGLPVVPLYVNRIAFITGYAGEAVRSNASGDLFQLPSVFRSVAELPYYDRVYVKTELISSLNTGIITGTRFSISATCSYALRDENSNGKITFSLGGTLLY